MSKHKLLQQPIYIIGSMIIITGSLLLTWIFALIAIAFYFYRIGQVQLQPEGGFASLIYTYIGSVFLAPLGLIPAYFISMKLAEILRQKYGWPLRHPRRLFLIALAIPIVLLTLSASLAS